MSPALLERAIAACEFPEGLEAVARKFFMTWEAVPFLVGEEPAGVMFVQGSEVHAVIFPEHRHSALQKHRLRAFMAPVLRRHGFLTTTVGLARKRQCRFVEQLGFQRVTENDRDAFYYLPMAPLEGTVLHDNGAHHEVA